MILWILFYILSVFSLTFAQKYDDEILDLSDFWPRLFGHPITNSARTLNKNFGNPEEQGIYLEGDLLVPVTAKNGIKSQSFRWKKGVVPFDIQGAFSKSQYK